MESELDFKGPFKELLEDPHLSDLIVENKGNGYWPVRVKFITGPKPDMPSSFGDMIRPIFEELGLNPENVYCFHATKEGNNVETSIIYKH